MENADFGNSYFTSKGMIPDIEDDFTCLWGRKLVKNMLSVHGLQGTFTLDSNDIVWINFDLQNRFLFPPTIDITYTALAKLGVGVYKNDLTHNNSITHLVNVFINGNNIGFQPSNNSGILEVYYRIYGV